jgi:hypothetical protein
MNINAKDVWVEAGQVSGKAYPENKARFWISGPAGYEAQVICALGSALQQRVYIDVALLRESLTQQGVPASVVEALCAGTAVEDETYLRIGSRP